VCPACGAEAVKVPSQVALGGTANAGRSQEQMPQTWRGTCGANPEYVTQLRHEWQQRQRLEEKHPELQGDRRPVLAHEGRFEHAPLRAGDPLPGPESHSHSHDHSRAHEHPHPHPPADGPAPR
jgi:hypothetical protein